MQNQMRPKFPPQQANGMGQGNPNLNFGKMQNEMQMQMQNKNPMQNQMPMMEGNSELIELFKQITKDILENDPEILALKKEIQSYKEKEYDNCLKTDLDKIKKSYPDENAKDISDLGEEFLKMMSTGMIDPITAYEAIRNIQSKKGVNTPSMGSVNTYNSKSQEYLSKEQVGKMSTQEVKRNFEKIQNSMKHW